MPGTEGRGGEQTIPECRTFYRTRHPILTSGEGIPLKRQANFRDGGVKMEETWSMWTLLGHWNDRPTARLSLRGMTIFPYCVSNTFGLLLKPVLAGFLLCIYHLIWHLINPVCMWVCRGLLHTALYMSKGFLFITLPTPLTCQMYVHPTSIYLNSFIPIHI